MYIAVDPLANVHVDDTERHNYSHNAIKRSSSPNLKLLNLTHYICVTYMVGWPYLDYNPSQFVSFTFPFHCFVTFFFLKFSFDIHQKVHLYVHTFFAFSFCVSPLGGVSHLFPSSPL